MKKHRSYTRRLVLITASVMLVGCGATFAQVGPPSSPATPPAGAPAGVIGSAPPAGSPASALGAIHLNLAAPITGIGVGTITSCPASGMAGTVSGLPVDPSDPMASGMTPATASFPLSPTDLLATENSQFGTSALSGNCSAPSAPPSPATVDTSTFGDGAIPLSATEGGGSGISPLIAVPAPGCQSSLMTPETATMPMPYDSNGATGTSSTC
jgi:hypothetical protein